MTSISLNEAQAKLPELIHQLGVGDEVVITENDQPVARLVSAATSSRPRQLGTLQGTILQMSPDFDAPLGDFEEYMQ